jgi:hypothetical protein
MQTPELFAPCRGEDLLQRALRESHGLLPLLRNSRDSQFPESFTATMLRGFGIMKSPERHRKNLTTMGGI